MSAPPPLLHMLVGQSLQTVETCADSASRCRSGTLLTAPGESGTLRMTARR